MSEPRRPRVAIVDYGLGNLFSVRQACHHAGMDATITSSRSEVANADGVILPGIGAFGDAMQTLRSLQLVDTLRGVADGGRPLVGICLGMQLLMDVSYEFGRHEGLGIIPGSVERFPDQIQGTARLKVPQVGWNRVHKPVAVPAAEDGWARGPMAGVADGEFMYFVHSYVVRPAAPDVVLAISRYGAVEFCSGVARANVVAWQFHPERSGPRGLRLYGNVAALMQQSMEARIDA